MILGMAGHVDHGKTSLVEALTGIDTAREEDRNRGLTIDLGFASLKSNQGRIGIVDVPGHSDFIKNMAAAVAGFDAAIVVISAKEGIQAQTHEHLQILQAFEISNLAIAISQCDLVDEVIIAERKQEISDFIFDFKEKSSVTSRAWSEVPLIAVSVVTGQGLKSLLRWIEDLQRSILKLEPTDNEKIRFPIDRVFQKNGIGTIVTGSLWSGRIKVGDQLRLLPRDQEVHVRGIEVHGNRVSEAIPHHRVALNIAKGAKNELARGMELVSSKTLQPTLQAGGWITPFSKRHSLKHDHKYRLHTSATHTITKLLTSKKNNNEPFAAVMKLQHPVVTHAEQSFVLRSIDGSKTIARGFFLASDAVGQLRSRCSNKFIKEIAQAMLHEDCVQALHSWINNCEDLILDFEQIRSNIGFTISELQSALAELTSAGDVIPIPEENRIISNSYFHRTMADILALFSCQKSIAKPVYSKSELLEKVPACRSQELMTLLLRRLTQEGKLFENNQSYRLRDPLTHMSARQNQTYQKVFQNYVDNKTGPTISELSDQLNINQKELKSLIRLAISENQLAYIGQDFVMTPQVLNQYLFVLKELFVDSDSLAVGAIRDRWRITRKHAIPLLEYFDWLELTKRDGHVRKQGPNFSRTINSFDSKPLH